MKAIVARDFAPLDKLEYADWPDPEPGPGEVVIAAEAIGVNYPDGLLVQGLYQMKPPVPFVPGMEIAGTIEVCGEGVAGLAPGERVLATLEHGGFAQAAVTAADNVVRVPDEVDDVAGVHVSVELDPDPDLLIHE
jgi:NADPH2:quinone reductase